MSKKDLLWLILSVLFLTWIMAMSIYGFSSVLMSYMPFSADFVVEATSGSLK